MLNGKKHGDWGPIYTQACWDAGKSACFADVADSEGIFHFKWVATNETRWRMTATGWSKRQGFNESCALNGCAGGDGSYSYTYYLETGWMCNDGDPQR